MKLKEFRSILESHPDALLRLTLPDGDRIPAHFHVTEIGHVAKKFIDCGGVTGEKEACVLQTWLGDDLEHRLTAGTLEKILNLGDKVLPTVDLEVEIEYDCCVVGQYPIARITRSDAHLEIALDNKRTQCLARERQAQPEASCCAEVATCC